MKHTASLSLDVAAPDQVIGVLRAAAERYTQDASELDAAHQDKNAGRPWREIAKALEAAATKIAKLPNPGSGLTLGERAALEAASRNVRD